MIKHTVTKRVDCRICGNKDLLKAVDLADSPAADNYVEHSDEFEKYPLELMLCRNCFQLQLSHVLQPHSIYQNYIYWTKTSPGLENHFQNYAVDAIQRLNINQGLIIDIGCNDGTLLTSFKQAGLNIYGIEPAENISSYLSSIGIKVRNSYLTKDCAKEVNRDIGSADIVTTNNVLANVDDAHSFVASVKILLKPNGVFIIECGYALSMIQNMVFDNIYHEHLSYFCIHSLENLLAEHGMIIFDALKIDTKGGSIRVFAQNKQHGTYPTSSRVSALKNEELAFRLNHIETLSTFSEKIKRLAEKVRKELQMLKNSGRSIAGYGASATVTTVLHEFNIADEIDFLVDDNPIKQGRFSPGFNLQVFDSKALNSLKPDVTIILPWRFADAIILKHKEYLDSGGSFLCFLPELKLISK